MALALKDRVKETTIVTGTGTATLLGSSIGFQPFSVVGNGNTTYYCISDQFGSNWEVGIGTYSSSGNTLTRTTVSASSNSGALVVFTAGVKDVFVTYPAEKGVWLDASGNAIGLGTPAAFVGTNITGTASGLTAGNVTTNANLTGAITSTGNATSLGSFTSANLAGALTDETGTGSAVFATSPTLVTPALGTPSALVGTNITGTATSFTASNVTTNANLTGAITSVGNATSLGSFTSANLAAALTNETGSGSAVFSDNATLLNPTYTGTLTGSTGVLNIGSGQVYKDASGNVGIGTSSPTSALQLSRSGGASLTASSTGGGANWEFGCDASGNGYIYSGQAKYLALSTNGSERARIDASGNLLVGTTAGGTQNANSMQYLVSNAQGYVTHVSGTGSGTGYWVFALGGTSIGSITQNGTTGVLYNITSDYRLKNNPTALTGASEFIMALQPKTWDWWDGSGKGVGFIAHEFMEVAKYSGNGTKDEVDAKGKPVMQSIQPSSSEVMANLVSFAQEQQTLIEALTARLTALEAK